MLLLFTYVLIALVFSFLCSIAEAVILSVTTAHIALLEHEEKPSGTLLHKLKEDINKPLAAILTLNTIAHTVGAAGAGAQAAVVFGSAYVGLASVVLTLLILVFSEIIPKTLGARYWRRLAPVTAYSLKFLIWFLYPFVKLSEKMTEGMTHGPTLKGFSRDEFSAIAEVSSQEGQLAQQESAILQNLLRLREIRVKDAMTPRTVVFSVSENITVEEFFHKHGHTRFSRIPVYSDNQEQVDGFVLRSDMLLAQARGNTDNILKTYSRELVVILDTMSLNQAFDEFIRSRAIIMLVVDEYGGMQGIITLEDLLETLLGQEIVDEGDKTVDMQKLARSRWKRRAREMGLDIDDTNSQD
jgi:CBS domain containing-hemolysin-like protein